MMQPNPTGIEQPCFIAEGVEIPDDAYVGAFAYIGKGAHIGNGAKYTLRPMWVKTLR